MNWLDRFKDRKVIYGAGSVVSVLLVVGILIVAALLADWHQARLGPDPGPDPIPFRGHPEPAETGG